MARPREKNPLSQGLSVKLHKGDYATFHKMCKKKNLKMAAVARNLIEDWIQKNK